MFTKKDKWKRKPASEKEKPQTDRHCTRKDTLKKHENKLNVGKKNVNTSNEQFILPPTPTYFPFFRSPNMFLLSILAPQTKQPNICK